MRLQNLLPCGELVWEGIFGFGGRSLGGYKLGPRLGM